MAKSFRDVLLKQQLRETRELGSFPLSLDLLRSGKKNKKAAEITQNEGEWCCKYWRETIPLVQMYLIQSNR